MPTLRPITAANPLVPLAAHMRAELTTAEARALHTALLELDRCSWRRAARAAQSPRGRAVLQLGTGTWCGAPNDAYVALVRRSCDLAAAVARADEDAYLHRLASCERMRPI